MKRCNGNCLVKNKTAQVLQLTISDEITDSEAKTLYHQPSVHTKSTDKVPDVNQVKGKETPPRPSSKPLLTF